MNKKKSKALAFLLAASLLVPSVNGIVSAAELDNVKSTDKVVASQEATNPDGSDTSTQDPVTQNIAKIGDKEYATLEAAINAASDGATIELLADVTEDITVNKNITIDGKNTYKIIGNTKLENGTLKNTTLKPKDEDSKGNVLQIGSTSENIINMYGVTVEYSVVNRSGGSNVIAGNNSNITIENCLFTNNPNNDGTINVLEWSFGLSMGVQGDKGSFNFINNEFNGAFRTMLPSINGKVTIKGNKFSNSALTVSPGTGNGANAQATCITTSAKSDVNNFNILDNTFNNPGAFYFQDIANVQNNTFVFDNSGHYIQLGGKAGRNLDLRNNTFKTESDGVVSIDTAGARVILPAGQTAINYWAWSDTPKEIKPDSYSSYKYSYNEDGSRTFYPESEAALKVFTNPTPGNIAVNDKEKIVVSNDMTIGNETSLDIPKGRNITIEVTKGKTLTLYSKDAVSVSGELTISGDGELSTTKSGEVSVNKDATLIIESKLDNKGTIENQGRIDNKKDLINSGIISNSGTLTNTNSGMLKNENKLANSGDLIVEKDIENKGTITNLGNINIYETSKIINDGSIITFPNKDIDNDKVSGNGKIEQNTSEKPTKVELKGINETAYSITVEIRNIVGIDKSTGIDCKIEKATGTISRKSTTSTSIIGNWVPVETDIVKFENLEPNTKYNVYIRYSGLNGTEVDTPLEVSTAAPSTGGGTIKPTYTHEEIIGTDRYDTAAKIADKLGSYDNVVLVNAESSMSDGLSASGLAGKENGAILLTKKDSIPKVTMDRIKKVKKVYIIGGEAAISQIVYDEITKNVPNVKVERLGGKDRVETSEIVAKKLGNYSDAFLVNGFKGEADAMSASAIAAKKGAPILLTNGKTSTHAKKSGVEYYVIGGNSVVDKSIADKYNAEVLAGKDRYATNKEVINEFYSGSDKVYIANGDKLVDALTASPLAKKDGIVLVNEKSDKSILKGKNTVQVGGMDFEIEFEK